MVVSAVLGATNLFRGARKAHLEALAAHCLTRDVARGQLVFSRGKCLSGIYAIAQGMVKLSVRHTPPAERVLRLVEAHETFGEAPALLHRPARCDAYALAATRLVVVPAAAVYRLIEADPAAARSTVRELAERCESFLAELEASTRTSAQRLAAYLDSLARPAALPGAWTAHLPATKTVIASRLDMKKETFSRLLRSLAEARRDRGEAGRHHDPRPRSPCHARDLSCDRSSA